MVNKNELSGMTVKELREVAKDLSITGRWKMTKQQLIEEITCKETQIEEKKEEDKNASVKPDKNLNNELKSASVDENKMRYVRDIDIGVLVAFTINGRVKSAKVLKKSSAKQVLKLEDKRGQDYIVPYSDIIWVRTGKRWPRGVYELLTGGRRNGKQTLVK